MVGRLGRMATNTSGTKRLGLGVTVAAVCVGFAPAPLAATNFLVTSTADAGSGTLRAAIEAANADILGAPHQISFNIPGIGAHEIVLQSDLPAILPSVTIDGYTQPGALPNTTAIGIDAQLLIAIDGSALPENSRILELRGDASTVRGLALYGVPGSFSNAILLRGAAAVIEGCFLGTDLTGTTARGIGDGIADIGVAGGHRIGGPLPSQRNLIAGARNRNIALATSNNVVQGNYVGTDRTGTRSIGQQGAGIFFLASGNAVASGNLIGGPNPSDGNLVSGLGLTAAIAIAGSLANTTPAGNTIQNNLIGVDPTGMLPVPNAGGGIVLSAVEGTVIGGPGAGNVIANNATGGISLLRTPTTIIRSNRIGVGLDDSPQPNSGHGIRLTGVSDALVGGLAPAEANVIANTQLPGGAGILILPDPPTGDSLRNRIAGNAIFANAGPAIDLVGADLLDGPTPNDPLDLDDGSNRLQNWPAVRSFLDQGASWLVSGELASAATTAYRIEIFSSPSCDPSGFGEGRTFLGAGTVTTDASGRARFDLTVAAPPAGELALAATATDPLGNTSELGACLAPRAIPTATTWTLLLLGSALGATGIVSLRR